LLLHCGFEENIPPGFGEAVLKKETVSKMRGIDYFFLGDIHRTHRKVVDHATVLIPGATERMNFGEMNEDPGFYYLELESKTPIKMQHQRIEPQAMRRETIRTTDLPADAPSEYVYEKIREWADAEQMMQLRIEGPLDREVYHRLKFFDIWRLGNELNFYFDLDRNGVQIKTEQANGGGGEMISIRHEIESVADELAQREGNDRALVEQAREWIVQRLHYDDN